jgi:hypothetical protein
MRDVNGLAALDRYMSSGRCNLEVEQVWEPEHNGMTSALLVIGMQNSHGSACKSGFSAGRL